jgi:sugar lactone lactonase YvrE
MVNGDDVEVPLSLLRLPRCRDQSEKENRMNPKHLIWGLTAAALLAPASVGVTANERSTNVSASRRPELLVSGLQGGSGSTIGPDGALYVTEGAAGRISRVDPRTGALTTFASGLPKAIIGIGGAIDVAFIGRRAYALVTLVGSDVGGNDVVGIYRIDSPTSFSIVADIGEFSRNNPPRTPFDLPTGVQYAIDAYRGGFLVTDGHHNRVLRVKLNGKIAELIAFDNIVPTGLAVSGSLVFIAQAGPVPHLPKDGKVVLFVPQLPFAIEIASGARFLVDVEFSPDRALYALSQGVFPEGDPPGAPALPETGALVKVNWDGTFSKVTERLNQPTSLEFIGETAYVVTLGGEIWTIDVGRPQ